MSTRQLSGRIEFQLTTATRTAPARPRSDDPLRIAILGDFSGQAGRGDIASAPAPALASRPAVRVDPDNIDELPARFGAEVHVPIGEPDGPAVAIRFAGPDDFHPDRIFKALDVFQQLESVRKRLADPATFAAAAEEVRSWTTDAPAADAPATPAAEAPAKPAKGESDADTLTRLLSGRWR